MRGRRDACRALPGRLLQRAVEHSGEAANVIHQLGEFLRQERLGSVDQGRLRLWMHIDHDPVGTGCNRGACQRGNQRPFPRRMRRIDEDRQMAHRLDDRNCGDIERVASGRLERADTPFHQDDLVVAFLVDVLRGIQPLVDRRSETALELDRPGLTTDFAKKREIRHVPGTDPDDIGIGSNQGNIARIKHLGNKRYLERFSYGRQEFEALFAKPLERIWGTARLEHIATQDVCAGRLDGLPCTQQLIAILDGTGTGDDCECPSTDTVTTDIDDGALFLQITIDESERSCDGHRSGDAVYRFPWNLAHRIEVAHRADHCSDLPFGYVRLGTC